MGSVARLINMKAFLTVLLAVSVSGEADPYTIGQVPTGQTNGGIITGVDYGHGLRSPVLPSVYHSVYPYAATHGLTYATPFTHGLTYGKREADPEPYTVGQIAHGAHIANAAAEGRLHNVGVITNAAIAPVTYAAVPTVPHAAVTYTHPAN